jgi:hypothetical protein
MDMAGLAIFAKTIAAFEDRILY